MPAHPDPTPHPAKVRVVVTDVVGLHRVLTLLMGRQHAFTRLEAEEAGAGRWTVSLDLVTTAPELELVTSRLHRLPSVLDVGVVSAVVLASTGGGVSGPARSSLRRPAGPGRPPPARRAAPRWWAGRRRRR